MAIIFKGFSSPVVGKTEVLYDQELIRQDLMNHFNTRKGERAMDATYGFIGWDLIFELDNSAYKQEIDTDVRRIVAMDPRLNLISLDVSTIDYGYQVYMVLEYVQLETVEDLTIVFDARSNSRMAQVTTS